MYYSRKDEFYSASYREVLGQRTAVRDQRNGLPCSGVLGEEAENGKGVHVVV